MSFRVAAIAPPRALRPPARGAHFWPAVAPLAGLSGATPAMHVFGMAQSIPGVLPTVVKDPFGSMVLDAPAAGRYDLRFDLAVTAEAELRQ